MSRICLFPGTFDPITLGHMDIIDRALTLFDKIIIGVGKNSSKSPMFSLEKRIMWIDEIYQGKDNVSVISYEGLTVECCKKVGAQFILRGLRKAGDYEYEKSIADINRQIAAVETIFIPSLPQFSFVESNLVRDLIKNNGDVSQFIDPVILNSF